MKQAKEAADWLRNEFSRRGLVAHVYEEAARQDARRIRVPVYLAEGDAYEKATVLQKVEDDWEKAFPRPEVQIFLEPAPPVR